MRLMQLLCKGFQWLNKPKYFKMVNNFQRAGIGHVTFMKMASEHSAATGMPVFLGPQEVERYLDFQQLYDALHRAFSNFSKRKDGGVVQPVRTVVAVEKYSGFLGLMPAFSEKDDALATKIVCYYPNNKHIATHQGIVVLNNAADGSIKAVMDGSVITDTRTAIASVVATKVIKIPSSPMKMAILGAGAQAISHHQAFSKFFDLAEVRIWSRTFSKVEELAKKLGAIACQTVEEAVKDADVIVTVTMSKTPILKAEWVKKGAHINCVGACRPDWQEVDSDLTRQAVVYCDSIEAAYKEAGDIIIPKVEVFGEVGDVINGTKEGFKDKTTIFKSLGMAIEDVVSAKLVYDQYMAQKAKM